jgi:hypothetical protein
VAPGWLPGTAHLSEWKKDSNRLALGLAREMNSGPDEGHLMVQTNALLKLICIEKETYLYIVETGQVNLTKLKHGLCSRAWFRQIETRTDKRVWSRSW